MGDIGSGAFGSVKLCRDVIDDEEVSGSKSIVNASMKIGVTAR